MTTLSLPSRRALLAACLLLSGAVHAGDFVQDTRASLPILMLVLTYDRNFDARGVGEFVVLVVGDANQAELSASLMTALKQMPGQTVKARPLKYALAEFKDEAALSAEIERTRAAALLIVPHASSETVKHAWEVAQDHQIYVLTLDVQMMQVGLPVGVEMIDGKPKVVINQNGARKVGAKFDSAVLRFARLVD